MALRWLLQKPMVPSVIIGATSIQQLEENMAAGSRIVLTPSQVRVFTSRYFLNLLNPFPVQLDYMGTKLWFVNMGSS